MCRFIDLITPAVAATAPVAYSPAGVTFIIDTNRIATAFAGHSNRVKIVYRRSAANIYVRRIDGGVTINNGHGLLKYHPQGLMQRTSAFKAFRGNIYPDSILATGYI